MKITKPGAGRERFLLAAVITAGLLFSGWYFAGASSLERVSGLRHERENLQAGLARFETTLGNLERVEEEWHSLKREQNRLESALPCFTAMPLVLGNFDRLLADFEESVHSFKAGDTAFEDGYATLQLTLNITGHTFHLQNLLRRLESFPHLVLIDTIKWSEQGREEAALEIDCRLVFVIPEQDAPEGGVDPDS